MAGGHNIETDVIRRRHSRGLRLLADHWDLCDEGIVFDARTQDIQGISISSRAGWQLLHGKVEAAGGRPLAVDPA